MEARVAGLIRILGSYEIEIERIRHEIIDAAGIHLEKAYLMIEKDTNGFITPSTLNTFLEANEVQAELEEAQVIVDQYDLSGDGHLSLADFTRAVRPQDRNQNKFNERMNHKDQNIKLALIKFFAKELDLLRRVNSQKAQISSKNWTSFDTYKCFDVRGNGSFTYEDFDRFLQKHGVILPHIDIRAAFRRVDKNRNGSVTYKELSETLFNETHLEQVSENCCCPGKVKSTKSPSKSASPNLQVKTEKISSEAASPGATRTTFATTHQTNLKNAQETIGRDNITRDLFSSQRLHGPSLYDVQTYTTPSVIYHARPVAAEYYAPDIIEHRFPRPVHHRAVSVAPPVRFHTMSYVKPVQHVTEYHSPPFYTTQTVLEKPVNTCVTPVYQTGFLKNRTYNTNLQTRFPVTYYPEYRPQPYKYLDSVHNRPLTSVAGPTSFVTHHEKPVYLLKDDVNGVLDFRVPRGSPVKQDLGAVSAIVTEGPFGRLTTTLNSSPSRVRRVEVSRSPSPMRVTTVTKLYDPADIQVRSGRFSHRLY